MVKEIRNASARVKELTKRKDGPENTITSGLSVLNILVRFGQVETAYKPIPTPTAAPAGPPKTAPYAAPLIAP